MSPPCDLDDRQDNHQDRRYIYSVRRPHCHVRILSFPCPFSRCFWGTTLPSHTTPRLSFPVFVALFRIPADVSPRTSTTTVNAVQTFSLYQIGDTFGDAFLNPRQLSSDEYLANYTPNATELATYTLLSNGSLVIVYPDPSNPATDAGRIAVQQPDDGGANFIIFTDGVYSNTSVLTCAVATDVDGTCPFTCSVSGVDAGAVFYDYESEDLVSIGPSMSIPAGSPVLALYAVGSAPATAGTTTKLLDHLT